jgi:peptide/nickel transport system substrate-binding protein
VRALVLTAVLAGGLAACSGLDVGANPGTGAGTGVKPTAGGRLVYGIEADPNGLDPTRNAWDNAGILLANALYDPVTAFDADGRPRPYLAESVTPSPDFLSWVVTLRPGVRFSDGDPLDATAAVTFFNALRASAITGPATRVIAGLEVIDPRTVRVVLSRPWASLPALLSGQGGYIISPRQLANPEGHSEPIGTGPFVLRRWEQDHRFELVRNRGYWRAGLPLLDAVDVVVEPSGTNRIDQVRGGGEDVTAVSAPWDLKHLDEVVATRPDAFHVEEDTGDAEKTSVLFNTSQAPFDDVRVRQAIAYATDVPALGAGSGWPSSAPAQGPISSTSPYFSPAAYPGHDVDRARALVAEYLRDPKVRKRPARLSFTVVAIEPFAALVQQLVTQWAAAGITATISLVDVKNLVRLAVSGDYSVMFWRYFAAPDPDIFWHFFVSDTVAPGISLNFARFRSDEITAGMNDGRSRPDVEGRREAYARVQAALARQLPYIWLQRWNWRVVTNGRVHDARNVTLPDGSPALPLVAGTHRLTETWIGP